MSRIGAKAILTSEPLDDIALDPALLIPLPPSQHARHLLGNEALEALAQEFLPRLLGYRLRQRATSAATQSDQRYPQSQVATLAIALRGCFTDEPALGDRLVELLAETLSNGHEARRRNPRLLVVELLWARCHEEGRTELYVAEITSDVNASFLDMGTNSSLSERLVGSLLRAVGLKTRGLGGTGRGIRMDQETRLAIHRLAKIYRVPSAQRPFPGCLECAKCNQLMGNDL